MSMQANRLPATTSWSFGTVATGGGALPPVEAGGLALVPPLVQAVRTMSAAERTIALRRAGESMQSSRAIRVKSPTGGAAAATVPAALGTLLA